MPAPPLSILQSLSPRVAVLASDDVADSCAANGCAGLDELLRPWEGGTDRVSILSTTLTPTVHPTFPLRFVPYASVYANPQLVSPNPELVVDLIGSGVGKLKPEDEQHYALTRALLLASRPLVPYETFNHPVGVLFAVSTSTPDPLSALTRLYGQAVGTGAQAAPWMDGVQVLKFFVVVHDVSKRGEDLTAANELLAAVKKTYGPHSTLLVINSRKDLPELPTPDATPHSEVPLPPPKDDDNPSALSQLYASTMSSLILSPTSAVAAETDGEERSTKRYAARLSPEDIQRLIALVRELVVQSLVPWMEARVREWNEAYQSSKRGLTGRLFGAGRKLFGSRPQSPAPAGAGGYNSIKGYYPANSAEALSRRLADFAFMLRDYRYASGVYDTLRRDYSQDRAFRYASAATEMFGLSQLLSHPYFLPNTPPSGRPTPLTNLQHSDISAWLEQAVLTYLGRPPAIQIQLDALRITVLYYEAWKALNEWRGVGAALVRAAGEADEAACAVLIEEAASADTKGGKSNRGHRRQAFHLVMAARRYEKSGLKHYSRRCLERASNIMRGAAWTAANDRIEYSLGRQAYTLGESNLAVEHFLRLLQRKDTHFAEHQGMVLEDMALAYEHLAAQPEQLEAVKDKLHLPTPVFNKVKTRIVLPAEASSRGSSEAWSELDSRALSHWDRKGKKPLSLLPDRSRIVASVGETFHVELTASNPLNSPLVLTGITVSLDPAESLDVETIDEIELDPYETRQIALSVTPKASGTFTVKAVSFNFHRFFPCVESLERRGRRLNNTKAQRLTPTYAKDTTLTVHVEGSSPRVAIEMFGVPESLYEGEVVEAQIKLQNRGALAVENVQLITNVYGILTLQHTDTPTSISNTIQPKSPLTLYPGTIAPGDTADVGVRFTAPSAGPVELLALAVFSTVEGGAAGGARLTHASDVKQLFTISTDVTPGRQGVLLNVQVTSHAPLPLELSALTPVSQHWKATPTAVPAGPLYPNQTLRTVLVVSASGTSAPDLGQPSLVANLGRVLQHNYDALTLIEPASVSLSLPDTDSGYLISRRRYRLRFAAQNLAALPKDLVPRVVPLFDPLDLDLAFSWTQGERRGHSAVHGLLPAPRFSIVEGLRRDIDSQAGAAKRTMYEETGRQRRALVDSVMDGVYAVDDDPISVRARVPSAKAGRVTHDFNKSLVLPVTIEVQNRSPALSARWALRLPGPQAQSFASAFPAPPIYTGALAHRGALAPGARTTVEVGLWVVESGLVSLGGWEVLAETGDGDPADITPSASSESDDATAAAAAWAPRASWSSVAGLSTIEVIQA
ncbi:hypothetical protein VHUM_01664 [Vanrija humicola]|uniref:TPPC8 first Ig-like domain-containing protein n=1 Tax=Vanrija humicola TaxID=5417 RepID=A0A7D8V2C6_VANHU|nr:hypothetical protein VHUM_01664 [Vanrija humicola]